MLRILLSLAVSLCLIANLYGQLQPPGKFLPHEYGQQFTPHYMLVDYVEHVAENSPNVKLVEYGLTPEGRPLLLAFISTPGNLAQLEEIRQNNLRHTGLLEGEPDSSLTRAIAWLSFGVHGNEAGASEASMSALYELARTDNKDAQSWLGNTIVILDPCINPDGFSRYTEWYRRYAPQNPTPEQVIAAVKPTILVGATARANTFTEEMISTMASHVKRPIVLPLSNPTSRSECTPEQAIRWSGGRAIVATGSPFADVEHDGQRHVIGQANNVFIFPGVGLGAAVAEAREITTEMFHIASATLANAVSQERLDQGAIYPHQSDLRRVSFQIACAVVRYASENNLGRRIHPEDVEDTVRRVVWDPKYVPMVRSQPEPMSMRY